MKKRLTSIIMSAILLFTISSPGCVGKKAERFWRLVEVSQARENGITNYYTDKEKQQQQKEVEEKMEYIHILGEKYKKPQ